MSISYDELNAVISNWATTPKDLDYIFAEAEQRNEIVFDIGSSSEMLRIAKDGFYVRGVKVEQTDREAEIVYNNFKQWLTWSQLNRD
jgi:hypothetical protein